MSPVAVVTQQPKRFELKSVEGGYVDIRPLPYGEKLERRDMASKMSMEAKQTNRRQRRSGEQSLSDKIDIDLLQKAARQFDYKNCIVDHNLTDENENKLDFSNPMTLQFLDPRIGTEIEEILDEVNGDEEEEELANLISVPTQSTAKTQKEDIATK